MVGFGVSQSMDDSICEASAAEGHPSAHLHHDGPHPVDHGAISRPLASCCFITRVTNDVMLTHAQIHAHVHIYGGGRITEVKAEIDLGRLGPSSTRRVNVRPLWRLGKAENKVLGVVRGRVSAGVAVEPDDETNHWCFWGSGLVCGRASRGRFPVSTNWGTSLQCVA